MGEEEFYGPVKCFLKLISSVLFELFIKLQTDFKDEICKTCRTFFMLNEHKVSWTLGTVFHSL